MALYIIALITLFIVVALGVKNQMNNARKQKLDAIAFRQKLIDAQLEILKKEKELIDKRHSDNEQKILDANN